MHSLSSFERTRVFGDHPVEARTAATQKSFSFIHHYIRRARLARAGHLNMEKGDFAMRRIAAHQPLTRMSGQAAPAATGPSAAVGDVENRPQATRPVFFCQKHAIFHVSDIEIRPEGRSNGVLSHRGECEAAMWREPHVWRFPRGTRRVADDNGLAAQRPAMKSGESMIQRRRAGRSNGSFHRTARADGTPSHPTPPSQKSPRLASHPTRFAAAFFSLTLFASSALILFTPGSRAFADPCGPICLPDADGDGHPLFGSLQYKMGSDPICTATGDFDNDGDIDLAVANSFAGVPSLNGDIAIMRNNGDGTFQNAPLGGPMRFATGTEPRSVAAADVNHDGNLDLVVAAQDDFLYVRLGNGDATFSPPAAFPVGARPRSVAVGMVDGDNNPDIVVLNAGPLGSHQPSTVSVLMGNGDGAFAAQSQYDVGLVGNNPDTPVDTPLGGYAHVLADLDGDGDLDLAVANSDINPSIGLPYYTLSVLMNNGDGTFAPRVAYPDLGGDVGLRPVAVAAGDVDGDNDLDLVTANEGDNDVSVLVNNGDGTFQYPAHYFASGFGDTPGPLLAKPRSVRFGDIDNDGDIDIAVGYLLTSRISILRNNGDGTFAPEEVFDTRRSPLFTSLADFNGDGWPDLAVADYADDRISIKLNDGFGDFLNDDTLGDSYLQDPLARAPTFVAIGDWDGDADDDLAVANAGSGGNGSSVSIILNNGNGTFADRVPLPAGAEPCSIVTADFNADTRPDLAVVNGLNGNDNTVSIMLGNGEGTFATHVPYGVGIAPRWVAVGDFDGENGPDLVVANVDYSGTGSISVLLNNGDGTFAAQTEIAAEHPWAVAAGDLNGDAHADIVIAHRVSSNPFITVLAGNGDGTFGAAVTYPVPVKWPRSLALADLDGDSDLDLVVGLTNDSNMGEPNVEVFLNDGAGTLLAGDMPVVTGAGQTDSVAIGDLDGDGILDLALGDSSIHTVSVLLGAGDGTFDAAVTYSRGGGANVSVGLSDLDGDGDLDIAATNQGDDTVSILWNVGAGRSATPLQPGDIDGDGDVDTVDADLFVQVLLGNDTGNPAHADQSDLNQSGAADGADISPFIDALLQ